MQPSVADISGKQRFIPLPYSVLLCLIVPNLYFFLIQRDTCKDVSYKKKNESNQTFVTSYAMVQ